MLPESPDDKPLILASDSTSSDRTGSDLEWMAFRYLAGEMSANEAEAYETLLAEDLAAGESLARMMRTVDAVAAVQPVAIPCSSPLQSSTPTGTSQWPLAAPRPVAERPVRWSLLTATAAGLVLAAGVLWTTPPHDPAIAESVITVWADLVEDDRRQAESVHGGESDLANDSDTQPVEVAEEDSGSELSVPGWLLAAVSDGESSDMDESHEPDNSPGVDSSGDESSKRED